MLDVIHTKGPSCGRGFVSGSQHRCFRVTSHPAHALDSTAESRQVPHRSPVHGFGWHHEGDSLEFHLHNLHQPQEGLPPGPRGLRVIWLAGRPRMCCAKARSAPKCSLPSSDRPAPTCVLRPEGHPQPSLSPLKTVPGRHLKMGSLAFLGFPFLTSGIQASSRVH